MQMQGKQGIYVLHRALGIYLDGVLHIVSCELVFCEFAKLPHSRNMVRLSCAIQLSLQNIPVILDK